MQKNYLLKILAVFLLLVSQASYGQQVFEVLVDSSEYYTDISTEMGRPLKFLAYQNRLIVLDYENYRILFYRRGTDFKDNKLLKIVGQHSRVQEGQPFHPVNYNRLSPEFTATIFKERLWVTNYTYGEILQFDLDGNYQLTLSGKLRVFGSADSVLYAFNDKSIYRFDSHQNKFVNLKNLPKSSKVNKDEYGTNVKIGYNRLCIKEGDSLYVYNFKEYLNNDTVDTLFSKTGTNMPDFEILPDKIVWSTDYYGNYQYCDLDGNNIHSGSFGQYTYTYNFTGDTLFFTGSWGLKMFDKELNELVSTSRNPLYLSLIFQGADSVNIYFYDHRDGGFAITPLDEDNSVFHYTPNNEIQYSGWNHEFRISNNYKYLLSEWPPDSFKVYEFYTDKMESFHFDIKKTQSFDVLGDTVFTIFGKNLTIYSTKGTLLEEYILRNLAESNLQNIDSTSELIIAVNKDNLFVGYNDTLNIFNHKGEFEKLYPFQMYQSSHLFSSDTHVFCTAPLNSLNISSGKVSAFAPESTPSGGFIYKNQYWYKAGTNKYGFIIPTEVGMEDSKSKIPIQFTLYQNYPNPFGESYHSGGNPGTKIKFALAKFSQVKIEVFNVLGQRVATLVKGSLPAGAHHVLWDGKDENGKVVASGVYIYKLSSKSRIQSRKMLFLR